jgi:hypothetical protein
MKQRESGKLPLLGGHQTCGRRRTKFFDLEDEKMPSGFFKRDRFRAEKFSIDPCSKNNCRDPA